MVKVLLAGFLAGALASSDVSELLAQDNECGDDAQCSLNALQRHALSKTAGPQALYAQCGGAKWTGSTECGPGGECREVDKYYSQCQPDGSPAPPPPPPPHEEMAKKAAGPAPPYTGPQAKLNHNGPTPKPTIVSEANPIIIRGQFLYDSVTGDRFFAKGVAYNPRNEKYDKSFGSNVKVEGWVDKCVPGNPDGPLPYTEDVQSDDHEEEWNTDLEAMANMGANTVRLYNIDPSKDHSKFMNKAASLGIYVIVPLNGKDWGFLPAFPSPSCYTQEIEGYGNVGVNALSFAKQVVKQFSKFPNTLMFTVANELPQNDKNGFAAFPCVKALTRDIHRYQKSCGSTMRKVPLIYSDVDMGPPDRGDIAKYLTCAVESEDDAVDAYGLNVYSWCDETYPGDGKADNFKYSPYYQIEKGFKNFGVPLLFTEFGCNLGTFKTKCPYKGGRTWPDLKHMIGENMGETLSGAVAFQWSMDKEEFGLTLSPNFLAGQTKLHLLDNYFALQKVFKEYDVNSKWDSKDASSCSFKPDDAAPLKYSHPQSKCPTSAVWLKLQKRHGLANISNWTEIPPAAVAPMADVNNQTECNEDEILPAAVQKSNCNSD